MDTAYSVDMDQRDFPTADLPRGDDPPSEFLRTSAPVIGERPGDHIGPYKLLSKLGEGGFGVVFAAEQSEPIKRRVALKVIKPGMDSAAVIARFEAERQALAMMDHPPDARVLDGGATDSGRPYFVMELVKGEPVTEICDRMHYGVRRRLEIFKLICDAVQHAHTKGVIHRDIKPANVLVALEGDRPMPKVIDFGVAKALNQGLSEATVFTAQGQLIGTPEYMSPEQAEMSGIDVDTRADIYSLGVVLYELITGALPFESQSLRSGGFAEMHRVIRDIDPPKPSTRLGTLGERHLTTVAKSRSLEPSQLTRTVRGDLDWIVMKAIEKDRQRRYETCRDFIADIDRLLANQAVVARPPSTVYRVRKFVRRNRLPLVAGALVFLALTGGLLASWTQWQRAEDARSREQIARADVQQQADQLREFISDVFLDKVVTEVRRLEGSVPTQQLVVDEGLRYLELLYQQAESLRQSRLADGGELDPEHAAAYERIIRDVAKGYSKLGEVQGSKRGGNLRKHEQAIAAQRKSLQLIQPLLDERPDDAELRRTAALCYLYIGDNQGELGRSEDARDAYTRAIGLVSSIPDDAENIFAIVRLEAALHLELARLAEDRTEETRLMQRSLDARKRAARLASSPNEKRVATRSLAVGHTNMGKFLVVSDQPERALLEFGEAIRIRRQLAQENPAAGRYRQDLAVTLLENAVAYEAVDDLRQARALYEEAVGILAGLGDADQTDFRLIERQAIGHARFGRACLIDGDTLAARHHLTAALDLLGPVLAREASSAQVREVAAEARLQLAQLDRNAGEIASSLEWLKPAIDLYAGLADEDEGMAETYATACRDMALTHAARGSQDGLPLSDRRASWAEVGIWVDRSIVAIDGRVDTAEAEERSRLVRMREELEGLAERSESQLGELRQLAGDSSTAG